VTERKWSKGLLHWLEGNGHVWAYGLVVEYSQYRDALKSDLGGSE